MEKERFKSLRVSENVFKKLSLIKLDNVKLKTFSDVIKSLLPK